MFANIPSNLIAFVLVLGFLVFAHESGHFFVAKAFRVRVLVFSFGFGTRLFGFKRGDTDYRVSLIPLGGYVIMAGDTPEERQEGADGEFLSKPKWQRFLILSAGPVANLIIAVIFLALFLMTGTEVLRDSEPIIGAIIEGEPAAMAGLIPGDRITEINGESIREWDDLQVAVGMNPEVEITLSYDRDGVVKSVELTPRRVMTDFGAAGRIGISPWLGTEVGRVLESSAAQTAGIKAGDSIVSASGEPVSQMADFQSRLEDAEGKPLEFEVERDGKIVALTLPASEDGVAYPGFALPTKIQTLAAVPALKESLRQNWTMTRYIFRVLSRMVAFEGSVKDFSGPISIARISGEMLRTGWNYVIYLMAAISLNLGILNFLPIPVLDGGHIAILGLEGVMRRDLSNQAKERIYQVGFFALAALMLVVIYNDVIQNVMLLRRG